MFTCFSFSFIGSALVVCAALGSVPMPAQAAGRQLSHAHCQEKIYDRFDEAGEHDLNQSKTRRCNRKATQLAEHYLTQDGKVYYFTSNIQRHNGCIRGTGDTTALFHNLSPGCMLEGTALVHDKEVRTLWLLAPYTAEFRGYTNAGKDLVGWQQDQNGRYALDGTAVYMDQHKLQGADPKQFSTYFPFGADDKWRRFLFSRSGARSYLYGQPIADVNLEKLAILEPRRCPEHGLACTYEYALDCDHDFWGCRGLLARSGNDLVYLQYRGASVFKGMAADDLFMFLTSKRVYFYSRGQFHQILPDRLDTSARIIDFDAALYEREP